MKQPSETDLKQFKKAVKNYYKKEGRTLPWRQTTDPYKIMVSEIMLQQTQADRVVPKYQAFIKAFPTLKSLANSQLKDVLVLWQGLGYNSRAKRLRDAAKMVIDTFDGVMPDIVSDMQTLPGVGPYTANAVMTFAYNQPNVFIETNIRTVYIHHFFTGKKAVTDSEILELVVATLETKHPRDWYNALMDYGVMLKQTVGNLSRQSTTYAKQTKFKGSDRELRAKVLRFVAASSGVSIAELRECFSNELHRLENIVQCLVKEDLVKQKGSRYCIAD